MENSVDPDQMASSKASWSGFQVFSEKDKPGFSWTMINLILNSNILRIDAQ